MTRILGLDPGSNIAGFAVIDLQGSKIAVVAHGTISGEKKTSFAARICSIGGQLTEIFNEHNPDITVLEKIFLGKNVDSAFRLGHARGVCMYESEKNNCQLAEYAARSVKKGITGSGASSKEHVRLMLSHRFQISRSMPIDASDALALAVYHASQIQIKQRLESRGVTI